MSNKQYIAKRIWYNVSDDVGGDFVRVPNEA